MRHLSVKAKLLLMLIIPLLLFATTSIYLLSLNSSNINHLSDALFRTGSRSSSLVLNADRDMYQALTSYMTAVSESSDEQKRTAAAKDFELNVGQVNDRLKQAITIVHDQGLGSRTHPDSGKALEQIAVEVLTQFEAWAKLADSHLKNRQSITLKGEDELVSNFNNARENVNQFGEIIDGYSEEIINKTNADKKKTNLITYSSLIVEWIALLTAGAWLIRQISRTVQSVMNKTRRVSEGFLELPQQTGYSNDELGRIQQSVDSMIGKMRELIGSIADNTRSVAAASDELHASANESSLAAGHVAENIQEVTSLVEVQSNITAEASKAMEEMAIGVQRIAESTGTISEHASDTNRQAEYGDELLAKLRVQLDEMTRSIMNMSRSVAVLNEKSERIGAITEQITGFANQTGILSLNASIEAARAGEHGRGFAVVAGEIRKLAASSLGSANEISGLIADTRTEIGNASDSMKSTVSQAEKGTAFMKDVADGFQAIAASIKQVASQIHDTSAVTEQMSAGAEEVSASMEQSSSAVREVASKAETVAAATEEQLALVENIAHSAEQLQEVVRSLNKAVHYFKL